MPDDMVPVRVDHTRSGDWTATNRAGYVVQRWPIGMLGEAGQRRDEIDAWLAERGCSLNWSSPEWPMGGGRQWDVIGPTDDWLLAQLMRRVIAEAWVVTYQDRRGVVLDGAVDVTPEELALMERLGG